MTRDKFYCKGMYTHSSKDEDEFKKTDFWARCTLLEASEQSFERPQNVFKVAHRDVFVTVNNL